MLRFHSGIAALTLLLALLAACSGGLEFTTRPTNSPSSPNGSTDAGVTPAPRPPGVPETAEAITRTTTLGEFMRTANEPPVGDGTRQLEAVDCQDGVATLRTSVETIYIALPCDSFLPTDAQSVFVDKEVAIVLRVTAERFQLLIETLANAQAEFTPAAIWLE